MQREERDRVREKAAWLVLVLFIADLIAVALAIVPPLFGYVGSESAPGSVHAHGCRC